MPQFLDIWTSYEQVRITFQGNHQQDYTNKKVKMSVKINNIAQTGLSVVRSAMSLHGNS